MATGSALKERARRAVVRRWAASVARQAQVRREQEVVGIGREGRGYSSEAPNKAEGLRTNVRTFPVH